MTNPSTPLINQYVALVKLDPFDSSINFVEEVAKRIINDLNLTIVKKAIQPFSPSGITLAYILSQSHLVIHTWPESGIMHLDLVICTDKSEKEFRNSLKNALTEYKVHSIELKTTSFDKI